MLLEVATQGFENPPFWRVFTFCFCVGRVQRPSPTIFRHYHIGGSTPSRLLEKSLSRLCDFAIAVYVYTQMSKSVQDATRFFQLSLIFIPLRLISSSAFTETSNSLNLFLKSNSSYLPIVQKFLFATLERFKTSTPRVSRQ